KSGQRLSPSEAGGVEEGRAGGAGDGERGAGVEEGERRRQPGDTGGGEGAPLDARRWRRRRRRQRDAVRVVVHEVLSEDFGLFTWPSGVVLACLVWARRREFAGVRVVEIGAGTALPGLLAAKLGASVVLTDREGAPWVLENMRGAVAANGLPTDDTAALPVALADGDGNRGGGGGGGGDSVCVRGGDGRSSRYREPGGDKKGETSVGGPSATAGKCSVRGLSWGSVAPAALRLAREQCPQVVLGADVFYSSEHFDSVLATVFLLLSASPAATSGAASDGGGGGGGDRCLDARARISNASFAASSPASLSRGDGDVAAGNRHAEPPAATAVAVASASGADHAGTAIALATTARAAVDPSPAAATRTAPDSSTSSSEPTGASTAAVADLGSPISTTSKRVFLTAYQERSARRSLRPLLQKWGMEARVIHGAPQRVVPPALWESGRYDSVALLEITLK
ncbi:unnamed protein product, partial [Hapterophycus canaliculatus]